MRPVRVAAAFLLGLLTACAQPGAAGVTGVGVADNPALSPALEAWRDFPVDQRPRPIVLIGDPLVEPGYRTGEAKTAVGAGRLELAATQPEAPPTVPVDLPDGHFDMPVLPAADAIDQIRRAGDPNAAVKPLRVTGVELGAAEFRTDRGRLHLPAWLLHAPDALGPLAWPAVDTSVLWPYKAVFGTPHSRMIAAGNGGALDADGVTLTLRLPAPHAPCPGNPTERTVVELTESSTAVEVELRTEPGSPAADSPRPDCATWGALTLADYTIRLTAPLGNRVVVDPAGNPLPVSVGS
ncbi:MAG TPA: hypothetical protein VGJ53_16135 [Micromonosporaceae bacterium]|jgi:hypothetical protein